MHSTAPRTVAAADCPDLELSSVRRLLNGLLVHHSACRPHVVSQTDQSPVAAGKIPIKLLMCQGALQVLQMQNHIRNSIR